MKCLSLALYCTLSVLLYVLEIILLLRLFHNLIFATPVYLLVTLVEYYIMLQTRVLSYRTAGTELPLNIYIYDFHIWIINA